MNACICGHAVEDHPHYGNCVGVLIEDGSGSEEPCRCVHYEEDAG